MRQTSERTVRQQALSIYRKSGLTGRSDLAAFFLEDVLLPTSTSSGVRASST
jgi:DNA-binding NarL/FixJ family response regulator